MNLKKLNESLEMVKKSLTESTDDVYDAIALWDMCHGHSSKAGLSADRIVRSNYPNFKKMAFELADLVDGTSVDEPAIPEKLRNISRSFERDFKDGKALADFKEYFGFKN